MTQSVLGGHLYVLQLIVTKNAKKHGVYPFTVLFLNPYPTFYSNFSGIGIDKVFPFWYY